MHAEAEGGTASHSLYKGSLENPEEASLFRSKMAPNVLSPAHRLAAKTDSGKNAAVAGSPPDGVSPPSARAKVKNEELDLEGRGRIEPGVESSSQRPEP